MTVSDGGTRRHRRATRALLSSSTLVEFTVALDIDGSAFDDSEDLYETVRERCACV